MSRLMTHGQRTDNGRNVKIELEFWKQNSQYSGCLIEPETYYTNVEDDQGSEIIPAQQQLTFEQCVASAYAENLAPFWTYNKKTKKCTLRSSKNFKIDSTDHVSGSSKCGYLANIDYSNTGKGSSINYVMCFGGFGGPPLPM